MHIHPAHIYGIPTGSDSQMVLFHQFPSTHQVNISSDYNDRIIHLNTYIIWMMLILWNIHIVVDLIWALYSSIWIKTFCSLGRFQGIWVWPMCLCVFTARHRQQMVLAISTQSPLISNSCDVSCSVDYDRLIMIDSTITFSKIMHLQKKPLPRKK